MKLKAVFFDLDGTLADTEMIHLECFNEAFKRINLPWCWDNTMYSHLLSVGGGVERIKYYSKKFTNNILTDEEVKKIHIIKTLCYKEKLTQPVPLRIGVKRLLKNLKDNNILIAVVTTSSRESTEPFLKNSMSNEIKFDLVITGDDVKDKKPHPEIYSKALLSLSIDAGSVIVIEDSNTGLKSAFLNQLTTIITPSFFTAGEDFVEAYSVISHLGEPDLPFEVLKNHSLSKNFIDVEVLEDILKKAEGDNLLQLGE